MVSEPGQRAMVATTAEYPVLAGVASPFPLPPLAGFSAPVTPAAIGQCHRRLRPGTRSGPYLIAAFARRRFGTPPRVAAGGHPGAARPGAAAGRLRGAQRLAERARPESARDLLRPYTLNLLVNTLVLTTSVTVLASAIAVAAAWCTERCELPGRRWWRLVVALPLAMPAYVSSFAWSSLGNS